MSIDRDVLTRLHLFREMDPDSLDALLDAAQPRTFAPEEVLFSEGEPAEVAFLVVSGQLEARLDDGDHTLGDIRPGEIVGETALLTRGGWRGATVVSVASSSALELTPQLMSDLSDNPAIMVLEQRLLGTMARRLRRMSLEIQKVMQEDLPTADPVAAAAPAPIQTLRSRLQSFFRGWSS